MSLILRLAWRDAWRHRGKTLIAVVMILVPVAAITAADVLFQTQRLDPSEVRDRTLGSVAAARLQVVELDGPPGQHPQAMRVDMQGSNPFTGSFASYAGSAPIPLPSAAVVRTVLGARPTVALVTGGARVRTTAGAENVIATQIDPRSPLVAGLYRLTAGRWPQGSDEITVNASLASAGPRLGSTAVLLGDGGRSRMYRIVGTAESTGERGQGLIVGLPGSLPTPPLSSGPSAQQFLVGGGPVTWGQVRELNKLGVVVASRLVIDHPGDVDRVASQYVGSGTNRQLTVTIAALVVAMVLLEVAFLAGPAFAVGARRQARTLALLAASGGTPTQARRVIEAGAIVVGTVASSAGLALGIGVAWILKAPFQATIDTWLGHFDVHPLDLLAVFGLGVLSAVMAALVPARAAARMDVVRVLGGRRGDGRPSTAAPLIGLVLLGAGIGLGAYGVTGTGPLRTYAFALCAIVSVVALPFLIPLIVVVTARAAGWLPVSLRFAVRDAARHRRRTVPAVAAVAATVAGVVTLGIAISSNEASGRAGYTPMLPMGGASISLQSDTPGPVNWQAIEARARAVLPGARLVPVVAVGDSAAPGLGFARGGRAIMQPDFHGLGAYLVGTSMPPSAGLADTDLAAANAALARGGLVLFTPDQGGPSRVTVTGLDGSHTTATAWVVTAPNAHQIAVLSPSVAAALRLPVAQTGVYLDPTSVSAGEESVLSQSLNAGDPPASLYVERGYRSDGRTQTLNLILTVLAAVLMIGGAVTATVLSLADAEPDLATLAAVGAGGRTRRTVAAGYALVVALLGAITGAAVGFIPGIAVSYPLSSKVAATTTAAAGRVVYFHSIPWGLIGVVVGILPLAIAALIWVSVRARLPMTARIQ